MERGGKHMDLYCRVRGVERDGKGFISWLNTCFLLCDQLEGEHFPDD